MARIKVSTSSPRLGSRDPAAHSPESHTVRRAVRCAMEETQGCAVGFQQLRRWLGVPLTTAWRWCNACDAPQVGAMFAMLERLPPKRRHELVDRFCREYPSFSHAKLSHDQDTIALMEELLTGPPNLITIQGEPEQMRGFLATAMGHALPRLAPRGGEVAGIDVRLPAHFVQVPGVWHPSRRLLLPEETRDFVRESWEHVRKSPASCTLLVGAWGAAPELREEILSMSRDRHVIVAEKSVVVPDKAGLQAAGRVQRLNVSPVKEQPSLIRIAWTA